jgi:hypothetical protein
MHYFLYIALALALQCFSLERAIAEYISPETIVVHTPKYSPSEIKIKPGTYYYTVSWQGIPVGTAEVENSINKNEADIVATAKTVNVIDLFYKLRHTSESTFALNTFRPLHFHTDQMENSKQRGADVTFDNEGKIEASTWKNNNRTELKFQSENITLDPISAAFLARSIPIEIGSNAKFDIFNGKHRYLITFNIIGREQIKVLDKNYDTFKVTPKVEKLTDSKGEKRLREATIWITADEKRDIVQLKSELFLGSISAKLAKFEPKPTNLIPPQAAPDFLRARLKP